jgi:cell division protein FtsL
MKLISKFLKSKAITTFKKNFENSQGYPILITITFFAILIVLCRMKTLEVDYSINDLNNLISRSIVENKDLKAKQAKLLSSENLRRMAVKHDFNLPTQQQILVIP